MNNTLEFIGTTEFRKLKTEAKEDSLTITIDGARICSWSDYWNAMSDAFSFPDLPSYLKPDYHSYYDFMTDLSWLKKDSIVLIIENAGSFLKDDTPLKNDIIKDFNEYLLPFWEEEVLNTVVGGKRKNFNVYFVEDD